MRFSRASDFSTAKKPGSTSPLSATPMARIACGPSCQCRDTVRWKLVRMALLGIAAAKDTDAGRSVNAVRACCCRFRMSVNGGPQRTAPTLKCQSGAGGGLAGCCAGISKTSPAPLCRPRQIAFPTSHASHYRSARFDRSAPGLPDSTDSARIAWVNTVCPARRKRFAPKPHLPASFASA